MLGAHATWPQGGNSVENGIYEILNRFRSGTMKIVRGQIDLMDEVRQYHRDERGKIVKTRDDILDAVRTAYMMRRFAKPRGDNVNYKPKYVMPQPNRPMRLR